MRKSKKYAEGGITLSLGGSDQPLSQSNLSTAMTGNSAYPFASSGGGTSNTTNTTVTVGGQTEQGAGPVPTFKKGGSVTSASRRADGCAQRGKTRGKMV
jgi:hypothetical protein